MTTARSLPAATAVTESLSVPQFSVISGAQVQAALRGRETQVMELVETIYRLHGDGDSVNPPSYFRLS